VRTGEIPWNVWRWPWWGYGLILSSIDRGFVQPLVSWKSTFKSTVHVLSVARCVGGVAPELSCLAFWSSWPTLNAHWLLDRDGPPPHPVLHGIIVVMNPIHPSGTLHTQTQYSVYVCVCVGTLVWRTIDDDTSHAESQRHCQNSSLFFSPKVQPRPAEVRRTNKYDRAKKPGFWAAASYMTVHCYSLYIYIYIYIYIYMINFILIKHKIYVFYWLGGCEYGANNQGSSTHLYIISPYFYINSPIIAVEKKS
jgi:hypothetical protein